MDAKDYFARNEIQWWKGEDDQPTGHMLSSQIACVNHLYSLRQRQDLATAVLRGVDPEIVSAEIVDDGFVEFEFIGERQYLKEKRFSRGANCTSVDAFMSGRTTAGERRSFLIEWKYTETYRREDKYIPERAYVYDELIRAEHSPFKAVEPRALYFERFYQMMRQTLLGWLICEHEDHGCSSYRNIQVAPEENTEFHSSVTSPLLAGKDICSAWRAVLKSPEFYISETPAGFMQPILGMRDTKSLTSYLDLRYWAGS